MKAQDVTPPGRRRFVGGQAAPRAAATLCVALAGLLALPAGAPGEPSIFDDNWKPPAESTAPKPAAPATPPPDEAAQAAPRMRPRPEPEPGPMKPPTPVPAPPAARAPVPTPAAVTAAEKIVNEVFKAEYARKTSVEQIAFARTLLSEAQQSHNDPTSLYVLLRDARDLASASGAPEVALEAVRGMRDNFQIGALSAKEMEQTTLTSAIHALVNSPMTIATYEITHRASDLALEMAEWDLSQGDYAGAATMGAVAETAAHKTMDWEYPTRVHGRVAWLAAIDAAFETDRAVIASLKTSPADPAANLAAGRFDFVYLDRPDLGLPMLAKGSDASLKMLALKDIAATGAASTPAKLAAAATAWSDEAKAAPAPIKDAMQRRALFLYDKAIAGAQGIEQVAIQKQQEELRTSRVLKGLNATYFRGEDLSAFAVTRVDKRLDLVWDRVVPDISVPRERFSARWTGWVKAAPGKYKLIIIYDDGVRIWIDGQLILDKWGESSGRETLAFDFNGRMQELTIEFRQRDGAACMGLGWIAPGATKPKAVPNEAFYRDPLPPGPVTEPWADVAADGNIHLTAAAAMLHGPGLRYSDDNGSSGQIYNWTQLTDWLSWDFHAPRGDYFVDLTYGCDGSAAGSVYTISSDTNRVGGTTGDTGGWESFQTVRLGRVNFGGGLQSLRIKASSKPRDGVMNLHEITLTPVKAGE